MAKRKRAALPADWRATTCPECGGELKYGEMIFSARSLQGWDEDGTLYVADDYKDFWDATDDEHLYCVGCLREWILPGEISFDEFVSNDG